MSAIYIQILKSLRLRVANALKCPEADVSNQTVAELLSLIFLLHGTYGSIGDFGTSFASIKKLIGSAIWDEPQLSSSFRTLLQLIVGNFLVVLVRN